MSPSSQNNIDRRQALDFLVTMERIREFERNAIKAAENNLVLGAIHPSIGQEAAGTGIVKALRRDDILLSTHRGHGHTLAKGADHLAMMRELLGRKGGCCGGKGGSMHIADFGVGMLGANGVVGANVVIAAGAAHGIKLKGDDRIVCCIFGDGAVNRGTFLEGLNWAKVFELPILFVCEDNRYSAATKTADMTAGEGASARARGLGLPATQIDGNDVLAVSELASQTIDRIRAGGGPELIHTLTYRQTGHTSFDPAAYRPQGEADQMIAGNDPIARLRETLLMDGYSIEELDSIHKTAKAEMQQALADATATDWPDDDTVFDDVQDIGSPAKEAF
ncbi:MAG TPA: thiamine pyrophosphate-dependent dehydrogenase E1 component subunit alpha [Rhizobiales bacterium]|nr:thiamine pyrophosphate-dependent dehydrogenase E1 component subunit alpha [Hyphomicrobiales bacterium]